MRRVATSLAIGTLAALVPGCGATSPRTSAHASPEHTPEPLASIAWRDASADAFEEAARTHRLVLLSLQADWCHWCHVMNETTLRDPAITARLAEHFVAVRAEADARPDLADRYGLWGWPATIVLTPEGREIAAIRGFRDAEALAAILDAALADPRPIDLYATEAPLGAAATFSGLDDAVAAAHAQLDATYDEAHDGWGTGQKYPFTAPVLEAMLREAPWPSRAERSLARYAELVDPVWGGMYQYSEQGDWAHPHFERIAVIQAGALEAFAEQHRRTGDDAWVRPGREIARFVRDFLVAPDGGIRASMDADLRIDGQPPVPGADYFAHDDAGRRALGLPRIDPAEYASTHGLVAAGLARFAITLAEGDPERASLLAMAERALSASLVSHREPTRGLFVHAANDITSQFHLADQVAMLRGMLALQHASGDARHARDARALADAIEATFCAPERGCRSTARLDDEHETVAALGGRVSLEENGRLAQSLAAVADLANERGYEDRARAYLVAAATPEAIRVQGRIVGDFLLGAHLVTHARAVAHVIGPADDPRTDALFEGALRAADLRVQVERVVPGEGRYPYPGEPSMFACGLDACAAPVTAPADVAPALRSLLE
ncbi:MAG: DUF255 domain-containing protein [Sandaracinaceae bacterium]|nr:DUF255 domain-containing protein [Sandaracinaceae bacterium]